jgi:hypothetical protein
MGERRRRRLFTILAAGAVCALLAAACGSSGHSNAAKGNAPASSDSTSPSTTGRAHTKTAAAKTRKHEARTTTSIAVSASHLARGATPTTGAAIFVPAIPAGGSAPGTPSSIPIESSPPPPPNAGPTTTVKPYNPGDGIDLSGTPGVSDAQVAAAEALVRGTLKYLPRYATEAAAEAAGYRTIGDYLPKFGLYDEHLVNWAYADDADVLDPQHPESLVYHYDPNNPSAPPTLQGAMYMLPPGSRFTDIPPLFNDPLTQWHVHNNICFQRTSDPVEQWVVDLFEFPPCTAPVMELGDVPMIHVWIQANPCGPFAAIPGIEAGQVAPGQTQNCDTAHAGVL